MIPAGPVMHNDPGGYFLPKPNLPPDKPSPEALIHERVIEILQQPLS